MGGGRELPKGRLPVTWRLSVTHEVQGPIFNNLDPVCGGEQAVTGTPVNTSKWKMTSQVISLVIWYYLRSPWSHHGEKKNDA